MKFRTKGFIKTFCYRDLFIPGFTIKVKVYGPSLRSADYRRPKPDAKETTLWATKLRHRLDRIIEN